MNILKRALSSARIRFRRLVNPVLLRNTARQLRLEDTFIIAGSNRSGTTWLQEVVATLPGAVTSFEPLHVDVVGPAREAGFHKLSYRGPTATDEQGLRYLEGVLSGREWHGYTAQFNTIAGCLAPKNLVVKFIHANGLIDWMSRQLPIRRPLVVVRHPAAVNASVLTKRWDLSDLKSTLLQSELVAASPDLQLYINNLNTPLEQLTARWCLENAILFKAGSGRRFDLVTYESLVLGGPAALIEMFENWNTEPPVGIAKAHSRDSWMTAENASYNSAQQRLAKWKSQITPQQTTDIVRVIRDFGIDFYSESTVPNEDRFAHCRADGLLNAALPASRAA
ncbi:MAG: hypothetical protein KDA69_14460 [Planctomycetaceae bacterium]|nr:hypothetical protein [Planctomycetaceae bacterium]